MKQTRTLLAKATSVERALGNLFVWIDVEIDTIRIAALACELVRKKVSQA
jgi:hypothetical protein